MIYQKFIPEGWEECDNVISKEKLKQAMENGQILQGIVKTCDSNYNLYIDFGNDVTGVIPRQEVEAINLDINGFPRPNICTGKVNQKVQFKVKDISRDDVIILSRRSVGKEALQWLKNDLKEGMVVNGIVKNIKPYGVFVEIGGGVCGLLHIEDISISRIKTPYERFKIGQKINVMIKSIDRKMGRVILTYKELLGTWEDNIKDIKEGTTIKGILRETEKFKNGVFVELKPNLVGLAEYKENVSYGQEVDVYVKKIIPEKKKIKLIIMN